MSENLLKRDEKNSKKEGEMLQLGKFAKVIFVVKKELNNNNLEIKEVNHTHTHTKKNTSRNRSTIVIESLQHTLK